MEVRVLSWALYHIRTYVVLDVSPFFMDAPKCERFVSDVGSAPYIDKRMTFDNDFACVVITFPVLQQLSGSSVGWFCRFRNLTVSIVS